MITFGGINKNGYHRIHSHTLPSEPKQWHANPISSRPFQADGILFTLFPPSVSALPTNLRPNDPHFPFLLPSPPPTHRKVTPYRWLTRLSSRSCLCLLEKEMGKRGEERRKGEMERKERERGGLRCTGEGERKEKGRKGSRE